MLAYGSMWQPISASVAGLCLMISSQAATLAAQNSQSSGKSAAELEIAVTFDDLPLGGRQFEVERMRAMTEKLLASITRNGVPAIGFVNEGKLYRLGQLDALSAVLGLWVEAGLELGNHTFSHASLQVTPVADYVEDVMRGETITTLLLAERGQTMRYFRHPYLRTGPTLEVRAEFEAFLHARGYTVAPVTIENSDWIFAAVYADAKERRDSETMTRVAEAYLEYTAAEFEFWEAVSTQLLGYQMKHVLLLHANELNADYFDDIVRLIRRRGYRFVRLSDALTDPAYALTDRFVGPSGVSWLYRWAFTQGVEMNWADEPEPPGFIQRLYENSR